MNPITALFNRFEKAGPPAARSFVSKFAALRNQGGLREAFRDLADSGGSAMPRAAEARLRKVPTAKLVSFLKAEAKRKGYTGLVAGIGRDGRDEIEELFIDEIIDPWPERGASRVDPKTGRALSNPPAGPSGEDDLSEFLRDLSATMELKDWPEGTWIRFGRDEGMDEREIVDFIEQAAGWVEDTTDGGRKAPERAAWASLR